MPEKLREEGEECGLEPSAKLCSRAVGWGIPRSCREEGGYCGKAQCKLLIEEGMGMTGSNTRGRALDQTGMG